MDWASETVTALKDNDIDLVVYLPDTVLGGLISKLEDDGDFDLVLVAREEEAVGILSGAWLGGRRGVLACQTSGLANTFNALGSLAKPAGLPFLGLVTRRGDLGDHNRAQTAAGYAMPRLLDLIGIRNRSIEDPAAVQRTIAMAAESLYSQEEPYVLLLERSVTEAER